MIYYEIYDRTFFRLNSIETACSPGPEAEEDLLRCTLRLPGILRESPFELGSIINERRLTLIRSCPAITQVGASSPRNSRNGET